MKVFSLTYVEYPASDEFGKLLAVLSLCPLVIVIVFVTVFALKRDLHTFFYGVGVIANGLLNFVLKHSIRQPRPSLEHGHREEWKLWEQYGMPSSHAQFMWFVTVYMLFFVTFRLHHSGRCMERTWKSLWLALCIAVSVLVSYGRVHLSYHTVSQVVWGAVIGAASGTAWFALVHVVLTPLFPWLAATRCAEMLMIRDYTSIPNVFWFEYTNARSEARKRLRKMKKPQ